MTLEITTTEKLILTMALENQIRDHEHCQKVWSKENPDDPRLSMTEETIDLTKALLEKVKGA